MTHRPAVQRPTSDPLIHVDGSRLLDRVGCRVRPAHLGACARECVAQVLGGPAPSNDRPLFRPDISPGGADRASVMRCGRSLMLSGWSAAVAVTVAVSCWPVPRLPGLPGAVTAPWPAQAPPPNPIAAEPDGRRVLSGGGAADHAVNAASLALRASRQPVRVTFGLRVVGCPGECGGAPVDRGIATSPSILHRSSVE